MNTKFITAIGAGLLVSGFAFAAAPAAPVAPMSHWYVGVGLNYYAGLTETLFDVSDQILPPGTTAEMKLSHKYIGYNIFAGNRQSKTFATEGGVNVNAHRTYTFTTDFANGDQLKAKMKYRNSYNVYYDALFSKSLSENFEVYAKAGVNYFYGEAKAETVFFDAATATETTTDVFTQKLSTFGINYGAGVQFNYNQFGIRAEYLHYQFRHNQEAIYGTPNMLHIDFLYYVN